jgi:hypothetical protein
VSGFITGDERMRLEREAAAAIAKEFPDWEWSAMSGTFRAVPKGTPVIDSRTLPGLLAKLRKRRDGAAGAG